VHREFVDVDSGDSDFVRVQVGDFALIILLARSPVDFLTMTTTSGLRHVSAFSQNRGGLGLSLAHFIFLRAWATLCPQGIPIIRYSFSIYPRLTRSAIGICWIQFHIDSRHSHLSPRTMVSRSRFPAFIIWQYVALCFLTASQTVCQNSWSSAWSVPSMITRRSFLRLLVMSESSILCTYWCLITDISVTSRSWAYISQLL